MPEQEEIQLGESVDESNDDVEKLEEGQTQEPDDKETDETKSEDEESESTEEGETPEGEESEEEFTDDFLAFVRQYEDEYGKLPESIKTDEDLLKSYLSSLSEMKRGQGDTHRLKEVEAALRTRGFQGGVDSLLSGDTGRLTDVRQLDNQSQAGGSFFSDKPVGKFVEDMVKDGQISDENKTYFRSVGTIVDSAIGPMFSQVEAAFNAILKNVSGNTDSLRGLQWGSLPQKARDAVERKDLDSIIKRGLADSYDDALTYHLFQNKETLGDLLKTAEKRGEEKGRKKLRRSGAIRKGRGKPQSKQKHKLEKFLNPDGTLDQDELNRISDDDAIKMLEAEMEEHNRNN